jgi:hypothetical protein
MKAQFKGLLTAAKQKKVYEKSSVVVLCITEPAKKNEFGEEINKSNTHQVTCLGRSLELLPAVLLDACKDNDVNIDPVEKVEVEVYVNSRDFTIEGKTYNKTELYLADIKFIK